MARLLIVDDDKNIRELLRLYLSRDGYELLFAEDGSKALDLYNELAPDLIILDVMLPVIGGYEVLKMIRSRSDVPIIMLTVKDAVEDKVMGLDGGADDYVTKPFDPKEVAARVRVHLKRRAAPNARHLSLGNTIIDEDRMQVTLNGKPIELKPKEIQHHG